jgi:NAD(P)-dependent dehydrogenase (short-subunit alcohol dehydrogenase family)
MSVHERALVVGGSSGIGAALVERYRAMGSSPIVWDLTGEPDVRCDISDAAQVDDAMRETLGRWGSPDEITVAAGIGHSGLLLDLDADEWDRVSGVNTKGVWLTMRAGARALIDAGRPGSIVAVTSVSAQLADRNMGLYCASKAAADMLVRVAAHEWGEHGIRVNAVAPGVTRTPMLGRAKPGTSWLEPVERRTALGRLGEADDIAEAIVAIHQLGWVTGQVLAADGGLGLQSPIDSYGWVRAQRLERERQSPEQQQRPQPDRG